MDRQAWWARVHRVAKESDRIENQVTERHLAPSHRRERFPGASPGGAVHLLRTGSPSTHPYGRLSWPCTGAQRTELDVTAGASSQGTDSEPRPPGLLLGVKLHPGLSTQNWRVKGSGGHHSPLSSQKQRRGGAPEPTPCTPPALLSLRPLLLISLLRACPPAPLIHDFPPNSGPRSFYKHTLLTSTVMTKLMLLEGHERVSRSSCNTHFLIPLLEPL